MGEAKAKKDAAIDKQLEDTFPASDPPKESQPGGGTFTSTEPPPKGRPERAVKKG